MKWALDAEADEPVPATSVRTRTTTRSVLRSQMPRRFTIDLPLLVPAFRALCLRRQMTTGVSNVEGYLSNTLKFDAAELRVRHGQVSRGAG